MVLHFRHVSFVLIGRQRRARKLQSRKFQEWHVDDTSRLKRTAHEYDFELLVDTLFRKSNVNRIKSRTAKFENKKSKLAWEGPRKISLVAKFILHLTFKRLHLGVSCLHPQRKMKEFRVRWRSARANFFHAFLLVPLVWLCDSVGVKCGNTTKSSRKCAGKMYISQSCRTPRRFYNLPCPLGRNSEEQQQMLGTYREPFSRPPKTANSCETFCCPGCHRDNMSCHVKMAFGTSIIWFLVPQFSQSTLYRRNLFLFSP